MTENDLDKLEAQGLDVSAYREQLAERRAREAEQQRRDRARWNNPTSLERLTPYVAIPRSIKTQFFKRMAGRAPWFGKIKWLRKYTEGHIVYVGVVKAPAEAWKGEKHVASTHTVVGVYATDDAHACNAGWVSRVALALRNMSEGKQRVASGCERIIDMIADEGDRGEMALPEAVAEGATAFVRRIDIDDRELPNGYLPTDGIVPHFCWEGTIRCIPADLYAWPSA